MQPQVEVKPVEKPIQAQEPAPAQQQNTKIEDPAPPIKTEENQANWRAYREKMEATRKEQEQSKRIAAEERARADALKAALEAITNKPTAHQQVQESAYGDNEETEDQRIDRKVNEKLNKYREDEDKRRQERDQEEAPQRILQAYPDFNQVVTTENCDYLDYHYPELTAPFKYMPEGIEKWAAMYRAVKKFVPNIESKKEAAKAEKNLSKPGSMSAPGTTQGGNAMPAARLDEARKRANWERMQRTLKGVS